MAEINHSGFQKLDTSNATTAFLQGTGSMKSIPSKSNGVAGLQWLHQFTFAPTATAESLEHCLDSINIAAEDHSVDLATHQSGIPIRRDISSWSRAEHAVCSTSTTALSATSSGMSISGLLEENCQVLQFSELEIMQMVIFSVDELHIAALLLPMVQQIDASKSDMQHGVSFSSLMSIEMLQARLSARFCVLDITRHSNG